MIEQVFVLCDNGMVMVHDLPLPSGVADRVAKGQLRLVNEDGSPIVDQYVAALKAEWVAYAVAQGMTEADADAMTKADLIELFSAK